MGFFKTKKEKKTVEVATAITTPLLKSPLPIFKEKSIWLDSLKDMDQKHLIYKNYSNNIENQLTSVSNYTTQSLYNNLKMIEEYRKYNTYILKPKDFKKIILDEKLEFGSLADITFPVTENTIENYDNIDYMVRMYGSATYQVPEMSNNIGFFSNRFNDFGYNTNYYDDCVAENIFWETFKQITPCYDNVSATKLNTNTTNNNSEFFILGKNLQFNSFGITDEKHIQAVMFSYNPYMKMITVHQNTYWEIDNRTEQEKVMSFTEYKEYKKNDHEHKYEPLVDMGPR